MTFPHSKFDSSNNKLRFRESGAVINFLYLQFLLGDQCDHWDHHNRHHNHIHLHYKSLPSLGVDVIVQLRDDLTGLKDEESFA